MSEANVEVVRRAYERWNRGDVQGWLDALHPEIIFDTSGVFPGFDSVYRGRKGMARFRDQMLEAWEHLRLEPVELLDRGSHVIAALRFEGLGRASGVEVAVDFHHIARLRDGLVDRLISRPGLKEALDAAGLEM